MHTHCRNGPDTPPAHQRFGYYACNFWLMFVILHTWSLWRASPRNLPVCLDSVAGRTYLRNCTHKDQKSPNHNRSVEGCASHLGTHSDIRPQNRLSPISFPWIWMGNRKLKQTPQHTLTLFPIISSLLYIIDIIDILGDALPLRR
jgi:hypothetical protein